MLCRFSSEEQSSNAQAALFIVGKGSGSGGCMHPAVSFLDQEFLSQIRAWRPPPGFGCAGQSASLFTCGSELLELGSSLCSWIRTGCLCSDRQPEACRRFERFREGALGWRSRCHFIWQHKLGAFFFFFCYGMMPSLLLPGIQMRPC